MSRLTDKRIAEATRAGREAGRLTMAQMAERLGFGGESTFSEWETDGNEGEPPKGMKKIHYILEVLRASPKSRDTFLQSIGALNGTLEKEHGETEEWAYLIAEADGAGDDLLRSMVTAIKLRLDERARSGPPKGRGERAAEA